jgi:hypothetical protein
LSAEDAYRLFNDLVVKGVLREFLKNQREFTGVPSGSRSQLSEVDASFEVAVQFFLGLIFAAEAEV